MPWQSPARLPRSSSRAPPAASPMNPLRELGERHLFRRERLWLTGLLALGGGGIREHVVGGIEQYLRQLRRHGMTNGGEHAQPRGDSGWPVDDRIHNQSRRFFGR